ncbi:VirD4-like conjugal transfer protein, CD1115 family [Clostridium faecium]|uniref:Type IV secretory system conjugative DNA transfer family protein n=2 Tax=Clostridium faecium TaxID=2762223 RepID=A0ABR8YNR7_9CLOT|nr:type IV secretory system conjugative DNA transfer family protein [Clostridium faecium]
MKSLRILSNWKFLASISTVVFIIVTLFINLLINSIVWIMDIIAGKADIQSFNIKSSIFNFKFLSFPIFYVVAYFIVAAVLCKVLFNIRASFASIKEGQKGTSRFTTIEELKEQYKAVPEKDEEFEGKAGVPVSRYKDKIFIDDSPVNNLIIGTTRSGKGEIFMFPAIDIYSRAKIKASMIFNDPKGELIAASKETLEKRGYRVELLNLLNPLNSMSYNPLQLIIDAYEKKNYSEAQSLCKTLTYTLYYKPGTKDPFWQNSAMSLVNALILAVIDKCFKECEPIEDEINKLNEQYKELLEEENNTEKIEAKINELETKKNKIKSKMTLYTVANMLSELGSKEDAFGVNELDKYFSTLEAQSVAKMQYATSNFAKGTTRGGIFATAMSELQIFTMDEIAKMTAKNSINLRDIAFNKVNGEENKPVALFMVTPDYDVSNHVIASIFVRQLYYVLAKEASLSKNGKCDRETIFFLDEFGNMPSIEGMANIITVCLGRGIRFNLVIQAYSQLKKLYGDDYKTILGNCGNQIYILTNENETAEEFSKLVGEKTIVSYSRSGEILDTTKHQTESVDSRRLLKPEELRALREGESVVVRVIKRQDLNRKKIIPYPIFNTGETCMKYRYEYLAKDFDNQKSLLSVNVETLHKDIDLKELLLFGNEDEEIDFKEIEQEQKNEKDINDDLILSEIFTIDEIFEIKDTIEKYFKNEVVIECNTKWSSFKEFVEEGDNKILRRYLSKGIQELENKDEGGELKYEKLNTEGFEEFEQSEVMDWEIEEFKIDEVEEWEWNKH